MQLSACFSSLCLRRSKNAPLRRERTSQISSSKLTHLEHNTKGPRLPQVQNCAQNPLQPGIFTSNLHSRAVGVERSVFVLELVWSCLIWFIMVVVLCLINLWHFSFANRPTHCTAQHISDLFRVLGKNQCALEVNHLAAKHGTSVNLCDSNAECIQWETECITNCAYETVAHELLLCKLV